jgi:vancomycin resistance protein VanJ
MTYNIHGGTLNLAKVLQAIRRADADVVCLQEAQRSSAAPTRALVSAIARGLPDHAFHRAQSIMTLVRAGSVAFDDELLVVGRRSRPIVRARFRHAGRTVTVVNTHFVLSSPVTSAPRTGIREFVRQAVEVRRTQTEALLAATRRERGTLIVCGDFNTPPRGHVYAMLADRWTDAFGAAGSGFGYTFASAMPVLRIDYVWLSRDLRPAGARVPAAAGSDHRPVVVDVAFR